MAFLKNIKQMFGFDDNSIYEDEKDNVNTEYKPYINPFKNEKQETANTAVAEDKKSEQTEADFDKAIHDEIKDKIIDIINASLPEFIKGCVDRDAELKYINEEFGTTFSTYTQNIRQAIEERAKSEWISERMNLEKRLQESGKKAEENAADGVQTHQTEDPLQLVQTHELIADTTHAFDGNPLNAFLSELVADGADVYIDGAVVTPHGTTQNTRINFRFGNRLACGASKHFKQRKFCSCEWNLLAVVMSTALCQVNLKFAYLYRTAVALVACHAAQDGADACDEFTRRAGLRNVVVCSEL